VLITLIPLLIFSAFHFYIIIFFTLDLLVTPIMPTSPTTIVLSNLIALVSLTKSSISNKIGLVPAGSP